VIFKFRDEGGLAGGPALAADGTLYLASNLAGLSALAPNGTVLWQRALPEAPAVGGPALGPTGEVYVADQTGGLAAVRPDGSLYWHLPGGSRGAPLAGPIVGPDGTVYYATEASLVAVEPGGAILWETALPTFSYASPVPRLSADARFLFFEDVVVDARTGSALYAESPQPLDKYTVGADGRIYLLSQNGLIEFRPSDGEAQLVERIRWDTNSLGLGFRYPQEGGVTPGGRTWLYFSSEFDFGKVAWLDAAGQPLTPLDYPYRGAVRLLGIDQADTTYVCGALVQIKPAAECRANRPGETAPLWKMRLEEGRTPVGGALTAGRLYVALAEGWLIALGD
jgi:outer membrane protein assembly factor BamB